MGNKAEESELKYYRERAYGQLKEKIYETYRGGGTFKCPFCEDKREEVHLYDELLEHARRRGQGSRNMTLKQQGQHLGLASYLTKYHAPRLPSPLSNKGDYHGRGEATPSMVLQPSAKQIHAASVKSSEVLMSIGEQAISVDQMEANTSSRLLHSSDIMSKTLKSAGEKGTYVNKNRSKKFVYPWKGILANVPVEFKDGKNVFESGKKLKEQLVKQGLNPEKVVPLWNFNGFSGWCLVDFTGDWIGYENAMKFHKAFEVDHHGKVDWHKYKAKPPRDELLYGWVATEEDYQSNSLLRKYLKKCNLKSIEDIEAEEEIKTSKLVSHLTSAIQAKDLKSKMMANKIQATTVTLNLLMDETEAMTEAYNKDLAEMHRDNQQRMEEMIIKHEGVERKIRSQYKQLKLREKELEKREFRNENEKRELSELTHQQRMNELADEVQKQVHENLMRLAEAQKKEKDALHKKAIELEEELGRKQALELEIERMRGAVKVIGHMDMGDDGGVEAKKKMEALEEELEEKVDELDSLEAFNQALIIKEKKASEELQEALEALISGLQQSGSKTKGARPSIGVKNIGELDAKPFVAAAERKYSSVEADEKAAKWWSEWESYVKDASWRPFKTISEDGVTKEVIDEENELLKELRNEVSEEAYDAVVTSITELKEYCGPEERAPRLELWNFKEERPSNLCEGIGFLLNKWKLARKKK